jgi:hypothetical protein
VISRKEAQKRRRDGKEREITDRIRRSDERHMSKRGKIRKRRRKQGRRKETRRQIVVWYGMNRGRKEKKRGGTTPVEIPRWFSGLYISIPRSYNKPLLAKAFCALAAVSPFRIRCSAFCHTGY